MYYPVNRALVEKPNYGENQGLRVHDELVGSADGVVAATLLDQHGRGSGHKRCEIQVSVLICWPISVIPGRFCIMWLIQI